MGKKAKIKKIRQESSKISSINNQYESTQFVEQLTQLGYQLEQIKRSPEVPVDKAEPQL
jgi:Holliday junction resolvasome RuvABC DNA-binding subunit